MKILILLLLLLLPRPAFALDWQHFVYVTSQGFVVVGNAADLGASQRCIGEGKCHEMNPWLLRFQRPIPFAAAKGAQAAGGLWLVDRIDNKWIASGVNYAIGGFFLGLAMHAEQVAHR